MRTLSDLRRVVRQLGDPKPPRAERLRTSRLAACYKCGPRFTPAGIKNISTTGVYLWTDIRPHVGDEVSLDFWETGGLECSLDLQLSIQARVARLGADGIGLEFLLPQGMNKGLWELLLRNIVVLSQPRHVAELFRTLRTMLFLCRLCPCEADEAIGLLSGRLPPDRTSIVARIAIGAELLLAAKPESGSMRAHPRVVADILFEGSWIPDEPTIQLWTGLLAASCSEDAPDDSNEIFAHLLGHFTPSQTRILIRGCEWALSHPASAGNCLPPSIILGPREMVAVTDVYDLYRNATDLAHLYNLGLIENVFDFTSYRPADSFDITPSRLGVELYKRCHGSRQKLEPELFEDAQAHLANFLPAPRPDIESETPPSLFPHLTARPKQEFT